MPSSADAGAVGEFAASLHGAFTRRQAASLGISSHVISRWKTTGLVEEPAPGVLVFTAAPHTFRQRLYVGTLAAADTGIAIAESSAFLHRIDGFDEPDLLDVTYARGAKVRIEGLRASQTAWTYPPSDIVRVDGIRCSGLARTVCDLASRGALVLERAVDDFERRKLSLGWLEWTARRLHAPGRAGIPLVFAEIEKRRSGGRVRDSWFEKLVELCIASPRIPGLVRQYDIHDDDGNFIGRVDLAVPAVRLAIEANSRRFHTGPRIELVDQRRDNRLGEIGWDVRYLGWEDATKTPKQVCAFIERMVARRARDLGVDLRSAS